MLKIQRLLYSKTLVKELLCNVCGGCRTFPAVRIILQNENTTLLGGK